MSQVMAESQLVEPLDRLARALQAPLALAPAQHFALVELTQSLIGMNRFSDAIQLLRILTAAQPDNGFAYRALGICMQELDQLEDARRHLDRAIEIDPQDQHALATRASVRLQQGDRPGAKRDVLAALELLQDSDSPLARRVRVLAKICT